MQTYHPFTVKYERNIYMILKNIKESLLTVVSLVWSLLQIVHSYLTSCYQMVRVFGDCLYQRFFQEKFDRAEVPDMPIDQLQLWNCFSYYPSVHCFSFLRGKRGKYYGKDKKNYPFEYLFTIDWGHPEGNILDTEHSEIPSEHKCAHILALDDGNYAAQPNNRILWDAPNYTVGNRVPDYYVQTTRWNVENKDWLTEDSKKMFYQTEDK